MVKHIVLIGPTACGKGKQSRALARDLDMVHVSVGNIMRQALLTDPSKDSIWYRCKNYVETGRLVPHQLAIKVLEERLATPDWREKGLILDGFPRSVAEASFLQATGILENCIFIEMRAADRFVHQAIFGRRYDPVTTKTHNIKDGSTLPAGVAQRLILRADDTADVTTFRLAQYRRALPDLKKYIEEMTTIHTVESGPEYHAYNLAVTVLKELDASPAPPSNL